MAESCAIGIDLGTTYSCAALCESDGNVIILKNELGQNTTPSHVAFADASSTTSTVGSSPQITVGDAAKYQSNVNPENSIYDVKRLIGRKFNDPIVQKDIKHWPFKVIDENNSPRVQVNGRTYHPEQISAMVLKYIKQQAEEHLGKTVTDAVITVPAYFNDGQRQATKDAGSIAGLNVLRIINEPTAAAIAYNHQLKQQKIGNSALKKKNVLIFDLGGGTFDLSLLTMDGSNIEVKAVDGDTHLGGQDFDNAMVEYCIKEFEKKHKVDLSKGKPNASNAALEKFNASKRLRRIKNECEIKKVNLSAAKFVQISIEVLYEGLDLSLRFTRNKFEEINQPLFDKCIEIVDRILKEARMGKEEIDDVVLVGGSSRIPKIQEMIKNYFGGKQPCQNIKQDEAVAYGAAVQASLMASKEAGRPQLPGHVDTEVKFSDVIPHSIGIEVRVDEGVEENFSVILPKNTTVPCRKSKGYATSFQNQTSVKIGIYEGQNVNVKDNHLLGEFLLEDLPPNCPKGEPIDVQMVMDEEGILQVTALCPSNRVKKDISVKALKGRLEPDQLAELGMQELYISTSTAEWATSTSF